MIIQIIYIFVRWKIGSNNLIAPRFWYPSPAWENVTHLSGTVAPATDSEVQFELSFSQQCTLNPNAIKRWTHFHWLRRD